MDPFEPQPQQEDFLEPRPVPVTPAAVEQLQQQCGELRTLFTATLLGLIVLCLSVDWVIGKQWRLVRRQINEQQPTFDRAKSEFRSTHDPMIRRFMDDLHKYAATHPDFRANLLDRYRVVLAPYFSAGAGIPHPSPIPTGTNFGVPRPPGQ